MSTPDILRVAWWLQARHGMHVFAVDHPGRPECGGSHRECDGQRGKHPRGQWPRLATISPAVIRAMLADGPWNIGVACKPSGLLVVDEDRPGAFAAFAASIGETVEPTFTVATAKGRHFYYRQDRGRAARQRTRAARRARDRRPRRRRRQRRLCRHMRQCPRDRRDLYPGRLLGADPAGTRMARRGAPAARRRSRGAPRRPVSTYSALKGLVRVVLEATPERDRNTRLYWSACRASELVSAGTVDEATATAVLVDAATRTGLPEAEALRTIASGMRTAEGARHG